MTPRSTRHPEPVVLARWRRIYLAGPMSGIEFCNYPAFFAAQTYWEHLGWAVENPASHFGGRTDLPYQTYIRAAIASLVKCEAIALLPGWGSSRGANLELDVARACDMEVFNARTGLPYEDF